MTPKPSSRKIYNDLQATTVAANAVGDSRSLLNLKANYEAAIANPTFRSSLRAAVAGSAAAAGAFNHTQSSTTAAIVGSVVGVGALFGEAVAESPWREYRYSNRLAAQTLVKTSFVALIGAGLGNIAGSREAKGVRENNVARNTLMLAEQLKENPTAQIQMVSSSDGLEAIVISYPNEDGTGTIQQTITAIKAGPGPALEVSDPTDNRPTPTKGPVARPRQ